MSAPGPAAYSSSVTWRPQVTGLPESSFCCMAMWTMKRFGAVPVVLAGFEEDAVAGPDRLDRTAFSLAQAYALGDVNGLPVGVGVPGGAGARGEVDARGGERRAAGGGRDGVDIDVAREPVG